MDNIEKELEELLKEVNLVKSKIENMITKVHMLSLQEKNKAVIPILVGSTSKDNNFPVEKTENIIILNPKGSGDNLLNPKGSGDNLLPTNPVADNNTNNIKVSDDDRYEAIKLEDFVKEYQAITKEVIEIEAYQRKSVHINQAIYPRMICLPDDDPKWIQRLFYFGYLDQIYTNTLQELKGLPEIFLWSANFLQEKNLTAKLNYKFFNATPEKNWPRGIHFVILRELNKQESISVDNTEIRYTKNKLDINNLYFKRAQGLKIILRQMRKIREEKKGHIVSKVYNQADVTIHIQDYSIMTEKDLKTLDTVIREIEENKESSEKCREIFCKENHKKECDKCIRRIQPFKEK